jgi:hypothetical protein
MSDSYLLSERLDRLEWRIGYISISTHGSFMAHYRRRPYLRVRPVASLYCRSGAFDYAETLCPEDFICFLIDLSLLGRR